MPHRNKHCCEALRADSNVRVLQSGAQTADSSLQQSNNHGVLQLNNRGPPELSTKVLPRSHLRGPEYCHLSEEQNVFHKPPKNLSILYIGPHNPLGSPTLQGLQAPYQHHNLKCQVPHTHHSNSGSSSSSSSSSGDSWGQSEQSTYIHTISVVQKYIKEIVSINTHLLTLWSTATCIMIQCDNKNLQCSIYQRFDRVRKQKMIIWHSKTNWVICTYCIQQGCKHW
jgi:hypothetical protein